MSDESTSLSVNGDGGGIGGPTSSPASNADSRLVASSSSSAGTAVGSSSEVFSSPTVNSPAGSPTSAAASITPGSDIGQSGFNGGVSPGPEPSCGTNAGVIAGAAVGAAVGAAILTFIITFMLLRRRNQKQRQDGTRNSGAGGFGKYNEKALPKDPSHREDVMIAAPVWQKHIPQSADDKTIRSSVKTLFDQVEVHVENFYRDSAVSLTESQQAELRRVDSPHLPESIVALLPRARSQTALIKHCLLSYIVASISTDDNSVQSLLPADYATLPHLSRAAKQKKPAFDQAFSQWRVLSVYLRPSPKTDSEYLSHRDANVTAAATAFSNAFEPWASNGYSDSTRRQNVAEIFKSAAEVGILIFSQPSTFTYQWNMTTTGAGEHRGGPSGGGAAVIVVTPAFLKVADENAVALERPQVMIQMATQSL